MENLKAAIYSGVTEDIVNAIIALAKDIRNTVPLMALCGFLHEHKCRRTANAFWKTVKDPYTKGHLERFSLSFTAEAVTASRAVSSWYACITSASELEAMCKAFRPCKTSPFPQGGLLKRPSIRKATES